MLVLVDGTSDDWFSRTKQRYDEQFKGSFCQTIAAQLGRKQAVYFEGPKIMGLETGDLAEKVARAVKNCSSSEPIFLCGFSRGGAAVIAAAKRINRKVEALFLFDAVDRALGVSTDVIPRNVAKAYHAIRDPKFAEKHEAEVAQDAVDLLKNMTKASLGLNFPTVASAFPTVASAVKLASSKIKDLDFKYNKHRYTAFGNTGLKADPPCRLFIHPYSATHGAMGGLPSDEVDTDRDIARRVGVWMAGNMQMHGYQNFLGR